MIIIPYKLPEDKFRIIEKTTQAGVKLYFPQFAHMGHEYYKRNKIFFWKKKLISNEECFDYIGIINDEFKTINTKDLWGKPEEVKLEDIIKISCKSYNDAWTIINKYKVHLAEIRKKYRETHLDKKIEDKIHNL